jgi:hypothetical protein
VDDDAGVIPWIQPPWAPGPAAAYGSLIQPTVFWRRSAMGDRPGFDDRLRYVGDLDMWLAISDATRCARIDEFLAVDHRHAASFSVAAEASMAEEGSEMRSRYRRGIWATAAGPLIARARGSLLRRLQWVRFVRSTRRSAMDGPWSRSNAVLRPSIGAADAVLALIPGQAMTRMARVRWAIEPMSLAGPDDPR